MSTFSCEEKRHVLLFVLKNSMDRHSIDHEGKWQELGLEMNRDWKEIRNAYNQWKMDTGDTVILQETNEKQPLDLVTFDEDCLLMDDFDVKDVVNGYEEEIEYVNNDGKLYDVNNYEEYLLNDPEVFNATVYNDQGVIEIRNKRQLDLNDFDIELLKTFEVQSNEELELKRKEHEKKMKIYKAQLDFATEVHQEKMKILKAKLQVIQEQVYHIDHVICNKNLERKFKSGPI